jgi:hypothetical protein
MWICRRCAAHVQEDVLECPCCAMPAPARLQPELANNISDEMRESPRSTQIHWLSLKALPNLRKQAQSPWVWALFGFVFGLGCGTVNFHGSLAQPILCGVALAVVFGLIGFNLHRCRCRGPGHPYPIEMGAIFGFFLPIVIVVIDSFTNHRGQKSLYYLISNILPAIGIGVGLALIGSGFLGSIAAALQLIPEFMGRCFGRKRPPRVALTETDSLGQQPTADTETSDKIITAEGQVFSQLDARFGIRREDD